MALWHEPVPLTGSSGGWGGDEPLQLVFKCDGCGRLSLAEGVKKATPWNSQKQVVVDPASWLPVQVGRREYHDVPEVIGDMAAEAHRCLGIKANRAAVALARAVVEATAKAKGITKGTLEKKIEKLFEERHIREHVMEAAHEVRFGGNEVAHGDLVAEPMSSATAGEILGLMDEILEEVFQSPARVAKLRQDRLEREQRQKAGKAATDGQGETTAEGGELVTLPAPAGEPPF